MGRVLDVDDLVRSDRSRQRPKITIEPRVIDLATAASVYGHSETTLRELAKHHGFPHLRIGRRMTIPVAAADAWFAARANGEPIESCQP